MDIHYLLNYLGGLFPTTPYMSVVLSQVVHDQVAIHKQKLLEPPLRARCIWFLKSGIVSASIFDKEGKEVVIRLYLFPVVFTDLNSFLYDRPSTMMLRAIGDVELQYVQLKDFKEQLLPLSDTRELKDQIMLHDQTLDQQRSSLISLSEEERFSEFAALYPMNRIPNVVGASFLNINTTKYCTLKAGWNGGGKHRI